MYVGHPTAEKTDRKEEAPREIVLRGLFFILFAYPACMALASSALAAVAHLVLLAAATGAGVVSAHLGDGPYNRAALRLAAG